MLNTFGRRAIIFEWPSNYRLQASIAPDPPDTQRPLPKSTVIVNDKEKHINRGCVRTAQWDTINVVFGRPKTWYGPWRSESEII